MYLKLGNTRLIVNSCRFFVKISKRNGNRFCKVSDSSNSFLAFFQSKFNIASSCGEFLTWIKIVYNKL